MARAFELKAGDVEKEGFPLPQGAAFIALAEVQPSRLPELKEVQDQVKADLVEEKAFAQGAGPGRRAQAQAEKLGPREGGRRARASCARRPPALVGRGQPLGDLGTSAALEDAAFSAPEKTLSEPVRASGGYAVLRVLEKKAFDPEAFARQKASLIAVPAPAEARASSSRPTCRPGPRARHRIERRRPSAFKPGAIGRAGDRVR